MIKYVAEIRLTISTANVNANENLIETAPTVPDEST